MFRTIPPVDRQFCQTQAFSRQAILTKTQKVLGRAILFTIRIHCQCPCASRLPRQSANFYRLRRRSASTWWYLCTTMNIEIDVCLYTLAAATKTVKHTTGEWAIPDPQLGTFSFSSLFLPIITRSSQITYGYGNSYYMMPSAHNNLDIAAVWRKLNKSIISRTDNYAHGWLDIAMQTYEYHSRHQRLHLLSSQTRCY